MEVKTNPMIQIEFNLFFKVFEIFGFQNFNALELCEENVKKNPSKQGLIRILILILILDTYLQLRYVFVEILL